MSIIKKIEKSLFESIKMDKKNTFSGRIFGVIGLGGSIAAFLLSITTGIGFLSGNGINVWLITLYPTAILLLCGLVFSGIQRLRGSFFSASLSIFLSAACLLIMIALAVFQAVSFGRIYVFPL